MKCSSLGQGSLIHRENLCLAVGFLCPQQFPQGVRSWLWHGRVEARFVHIFRLTCLFELYHTFIHLGLILKCAYMHAQICVWERKKVWTVSMPLCFATYSLPESGTWCSFRRWNTAKSPVAEERGDKEKKLCMKEKERGKGGRRQTEREREREREREKYKSTHITACNDKTWDWVFTFATGQLLHCCWAFDYLWFLKAFLVNHALTLTPTVNSATSYFSVNCDVSSLSFWGMGVEGEGSGFTDRMWSHSEQDLVALVLPMAISASKQPAWFH